MKYSNIQNPEEVIEATQWKKNGDHPLDNSLPMQPEEGDEELHYTEGSIVRRFNDPEVPGESLCEICGRNMREHGFVEGRLSALEVDGDQIVCPGDYIVTMEGGYIVFPADTFEYTYKEIPDLPGAASPKEALLMDYGKAMLDFSDQHIDLGGKEFKDIHPSSYDHLLELSRLMNNGTVPSKKERMGALRQAHGYLQGRFSKLNHK